MEKTLLSRPPFTHEAATPGSSPIHYATFSNDFVGSLRQVLFSYIQEKDLGLKLVAELCNTSKRSLQRKLTEKGTRFSEMVDHVRFHAASRMLQDPDMTVTDVSHLLGYSDPTHFSRAFRRIAGVNPRMYRQACVH